MGLKKKVVPTAEPGFVDEEGNDQGLDEEEEDSGRGLLIAVNSHVVNEDDDDDDEEEENSEASKKSEFCILRPQASSFLTG